MKLSHLAGDTQPCLLNELNPPTHPEGPACDGSGGVGHMASATQMAEIRLDTELQAPFVL